MRVVIVGFFYMDYLAILSSLMVPGSKKREMLKIDVYSQ